MLLLYSLVAMNIDSYLQDHGIPFERFEHEAVFTCEESDKLPPIPGQDTKNLLLRNKKKTQIFLVTVGHEKQVDLKALEQTLDAGRLSFASPDLMMECLGVTPGSVTLLGLVHDKEHRVQVVIDQNIWDAESIKCHPLVNTATVRIPHAGLETFLESTGHEPRVVEVPAKA